MIVFYYTVNNLYNMIIRKVIYKGKEYTVYNPGVILCSRNKRVIFDQLLDGVTPIPRKRVGGPRSYILEKYNLTLEEYHFIVVHQADESLIPKCPICKCNNRKLISVVKGYDLTCGSHSCVMSHREMTKRSSGGAYERSHALRSEISRRICLRQIEEGTHNFQNSDGSWRSREVQNELVRMNNHHWQACNGYSEVARERNLKWNELGINPFQSNFVTLKSDRGYFLSLGNEDDVCSFYEAMILDNSLVFKIGVTSDLSRRSNFRGEQHYSSIAEVFKASRIEVANIEYEVKLKFYGKAVIGTETFPIEMRDEILNYAKSLYNK